MNILDALYRWDRDHPSMSNIRLTTMQARQIHAASNTGHPNYPVFNPGPGDHVIGRRIIYVSTEQNSDMYRYLREAEMTNNDPWKAQVGGSHYTDMAIQPSEYITKNEIGWFAGNVIKYVSRYLFKGNPLQDLKKARHYLDLLITETEKEEALAKAKADSDAYIEVNRVRPDVVEGK